MRCAPYLKPLRIPGPGRVMVNVNDKRPVNLDLMTIKFPVTALASISHRVAGVALFFALPLLLWMLDRSLASADSFAALQALLASPLVKLVLWAILAAVLYHLVAGIKHLFMDWGIGETLEGGRRAAIASFIIAALLILAAGAWLWV